jgi:hypothetical protein
MNPAGSRRNASAVVMDMRSDRMSRLLERDPDWARHPAHGEPFKV